MPLTAPPEDIYSDVDTAFASIQAHAKEQGYAFTRLTSKPKRRVFACDRAGRYDPRGKGLNTHKSKQRNNTGSKKSDCLIRVDLRLNSLTNTWTLKVLEASHNHEPSLDFTSHPAHRLAALPPDAHRTINTLARSGLLPTQILTTLRCLNPEVPLIPKDISNLTQRLRFNELDGKTPIQWLLEVRYYPFYSILY
jgi:hypothetical protein